MRNLILCLFLVFTVVHGTTEKYMNHEKSGHEDILHSNTRSYPSHKGMATYVDLFNSPRSVIHKNKPVFQTMLRDSNFSYSDYHSIVETLRTDLSDVSKSSSFMKSLRSSPGYSDFQKCQTDQTSLLTGVSTGTPWAFRMLDSWGKPGSGLLRSQIKFLGDYDECIETETGQSFDSQYCLEIIVVKKIGPIEFKDWLPLGLGTCVPSSCTKEELQAILQIYLSSLAPNITAGVYYSECIDTDMPLTTKAKAVIAVCSIFAALLFFATIYDILAVQGVWMLFSPRSRANTIWLAEHSAGDSVKVDTEHRSEYEPLLDPKTTNQSYKPGALGKILLSFSVYTNGGKLLSTKTGSGSIECINGIRFISMTWVILGHTYVMGLQGMDNVNEYLTKAYTRWTFQGILSALVSVDTFFVLSGLLMTYLIMKELKKTRPDGPIWPQQGVEVNECEGSWWTNLLYINNLVKTKEMCMGWSWYLANDMQFFIISPLIFLPLFRFGTKALVIPLAMLLGNAICAGVISVENKLDPNLDILNSQANDYFDVYYIKPYTRIGPYLVGMITGYLLYHTESRARIDRVVVLLGWCFAWVIALAVVYGLSSHTNGHPLTNDIAALYNALHRIGWAMALGWVIFACANGYGGFINTILSWKGFVPLSRLTYCAYLVHPLVIFYYYFSHRKLFYLDNSNVAFAFLGTLVISYGVAFIASMAYEAPMPGLEKSLIGNIGRGVSRLIKKTVGRVNTAAPDTKPQQYSTM